MNGFLRKFNILLLLVASVYETNAFAKNIIIQWKEIEGAIGYELQVQGEVGLVVRRTLQDSKYKGDLQPGTYTYRIRAIDQAKRPGIWSEPRPLAILPPPPKPKFPPDGTKINFYSPSIPTVLKWDEVPGVKQYTIDLKKDGQVVSRTVVDGTKLELKALPAGKYSWSVNAILQAKGRTPAAEGKKWETEASHTEDFNVEYKKLEAPKLISPLGIDLPPDDGKIKLHWAEVEGAQLYEVQLLKVKKGGEKGRNLALELEKTKRFQTHETSLMSQVPAEGEYVWGVRALANLDENKVPQAIGPESVGHFNLDRNATFKDDLGYIALSMMLAPYNYSVKSPSNGVGDTSPASATAMVFRLSGEFWFKPQWALATSVDVAAFMLNDTMYYRNSIELTAKYRVKLSPGRFGWGVSPKLGGELRTYNQITPANALIGDFNPPYKENSISVLGVTAGFDIRRQFSDKFSLGIKTGYFIPLVPLSGVGTGGALSGSLSYRNFSAGAQALYWLSPSWALAGGGYFEMRSISFTLPGTGDEQISMDGSYFFGSLIFRIWK